MGWLTNSEKESEEIRGVPDAKLPFLDDGRLVMLTLARLLQAIGCDDAALIEELYRRGRSNF